jgi:hypothetical protein
LGLKENVEAVKKELSSEEQFLESVIKAEGFFKKYKKLLIALAVTIVLVALGSAFYQYLQEKSLNESNKAYKTLLKTPTDEKALSTLKSKNQGLYQLFVFSNSIKDGKFDDLKSKIKDPILLDLVEYQKASSEGTDLSAYTTKQSALLKDFAKLQSVYTLLKNDKKEEASKLLSEISKNSPLQQIVQSFKHYK